MGIFLQLLEQGFVFPRKFDVVVFNKRLQGQDADLLALAVVDLLHRQIDAGFAGPLRHDLRKEILELHRLNPEALIWFAEIPHRPALHLNRVVYDGVRRPALG